MVELRTGQKAPTLKLNDQDGKARSLTDLCKESKYVVLYFYPKDLTPGCTIEAQEFSKNIAAFKKLGTSVVGVSGGGSDSKKKFCEKHSLKITLLADEDFSVSKKFGAFGEKKFMGKTYNGILRKTFIINSKGQVSHIYAEVKPEGHAKEVQTFIANIGKKFEKGRGAKILESTKREKRSSKTKVVSKAEGAKKKSKR